MGTLAEQQTTVPGEPGAAQPRTPSATTRAWMKVGNRFMPFADIATADVPLSRFLRLSLFQVTVGMVQTLFFGTLNRVMIVELHISATLVSVMIAIPLLVAPFRALVGFRSDTYRSVLGWRRVPFIWFGSMLQFSGLAIMPFALIILSGDQAWGPRAIAYVLSALAFFLVGAGAHTVQTAGLALATDLAPEDSRPRVVALMYLMLIVGTVISAFILGGLLRDYSHLRLIQVIQGAAVFTLFVNMVALWKQEARQRGMKEYEPGERRPMFREAWRVFADGGQAVRLLVAVGLGFFAFNMQDVLLEPYGGEILHLTVSQTTLLTGIMAVGALLAFAISAQLLELGWRPLQMAMLGCVIGVLAFLLVIGSSHVGGAGFFRMGTMFIGLGEGLFGVGTLCAAMGLKDKAQHGIALGAWGAVFATSEGIGLASSGAIRDAMVGLQASGKLPAGWTAPAVPYNIVYHIEWIVLLVTAVSLYFLLRSTRADATGTPIPGKFGLVDLPT
jgi:BCD family chlorophyll transporter-like MFS transporter